MKRNFLKHITNIPIQASYLLLLIALVITLMPHFDYEIQPLFGMSANSIAVAISLIAITFISIYKDVKRADFVISIVLSAVIFHLANYNELIAIVSALIAIITIAKQIDAQQETSEAQFIFDINDKYVSNEDYKHIYTLLDSYQILLDTGASREELDAQEERLNNLSNSQISNYLTFFEVLNLLRLKGSVKLEMMDDLFAYRFFIAVRNPVIYRRKLKYGNFANIRQLHDEWVAYRVERNLKIYGVQCYE